jgi:hypothetical protein
MKLAAALAIMSSLALPGVLGTDPTSLGIGYICSAEHIIRPTGATPAIMLTGVGNGFERADTTNAAAQAWFNEGMNLYQRSTTSRPAQPSPAPPRSTRPVRFANGGWRSGWVPP